MFPIEWFLQLISTWVKHRSLIVFFPMFLLDSPWKTSVFWSFQEEQKRNIGRKTVNGLNSEIACEQLFLQKQRVFLKTSQHSQENTCARVAFLTLWWRQYFFAKVPKNSDFSRDFQFYRNIVQNACVISLEKAIILYNG